MSSESWRPWRAGSAEESRENDERVRCRTAADAYPDAGSSCRGLTEVLGRCGYALDVVGSAREALLLAQTGRWDALVLDVGLPDMDGVELYTRLRPRSGRECVPLIFVTGYSVQSLVRSLQRIPDENALFRSAGAARFLAALEARLLSEDTAVSAAAQPSPACRRHRSGRV